MADSSSKAITGLSVFSTGLATYIVDRMNEMTIGQSAAHAILTVGVTSIVSIAIISLYPALISPVGIFIISTFSSMSSDFLYYKVSVIKNVVDDLGGFIDKLIEIEVPENEGLELYSY